MKEIIKDNGKIRYCTSNMINLGYWGILWHFCGYVKYVKSIDYKALGESLLNVLFMVIAIVTLPIAPFIDAWIKLDRAKKEAKRYK